MQNYESSYEEKYLKYKNKYLSLKNKLNNQNGGEIRLIIKNLLTSKKFPVGTYKVHVKMLEGEKDSSNWFKICHNYSIFSLYEIDQKLCCNFGTEFFKDVLKPVCRGDMCDYKKSCDSGVCDVVRKLTCTENCTIKEFKVRLYNFSDTRTLVCGPIDNTFYPHSARVDGGMCWHKFNGYNFIIAIETDDEKLQNFNYCLAKEITIHSYDVPTSIFKDAVETDQVYNVII